MWLPVQTIKKLIKTATAEEEINPSLKTMLCGGK